MFKLVMQLTSGPLLLFYSRSCQIISMKGLIKVLMSDSYHAFVTLLSLESIVLLRHTRLFILVVVVNYQIYKTNIIVSTFASQLSESFRLKILKIPTDRSVQEQNSHTFLQTFNFNKWAMYRYTYTLERRTIYMLMAMNKEVTNSHISVPMW